MFYSYLNFISQTKSKPTHMNLKKKKHFWNQTDTRRRRLYSSVCVASVRCISRLRAQTFARLAVRLCRHYQTKIGEFLREMLVFLIIITVCVCLFLKLVACYSMWCQSWWLWIENVGQTNTSRWERVFISCRSYWPANLYHVCLAIHSSPRGRLDELTQALGQPAGTVSAQKKTFSSTLKTFFFCLL